jgi:Tol biopolymer transport system component
MQAITFSCARTSPAKGSRSPGHHRPYPRISRLPLCQQRGLKLGPPSPTPARVRILAGALAATFLLHPAARLLAASPQAASVASQPSLSGSASSFNPVISADGRWVVFVSQANNLCVEDDLGLNLDLFAYEVAAGKTSLVSVNAAGTGGANADANYPALSADGRFVAFASAAGNLTANDSNQSSDVFLRDLLLGVTELISADTNGLAPATTALGSSHPLISADGRWVFFDSAADGLVTNLNVGRGGLQVYARDRAGSNTVLVSANPDGTYGRTTSESKNTLAAITPDGRRAAFLSIDAYLWPNWSAMVNVLVRDLESGITFGASSNVASFFPGVYSDCLNAALSSDGRFVVFTAGRAPAASASRGILFRCDLDTAQTTALASNVALADRPTVSADGRSVAYGDGTNVWVWNEAASSNLLVSASLTGQPGQGLSKTPSITPDGRYVAFLSTARDLVTNLTNGKFQLFVRDLAAGVTRIATLNVSGGPSRVGHEFIEPALSSDARWLAFESDDDDLVPGDLNRARDVFLRDLAADSTVLVSQRHPDRPAATGTTYCDAPTGNALSADARLLVFGTYDASLVPPDTNGWHTLVLRDLVTGTNRTIAARTNSLVNPILSANGRYLLLTMWTLRPNLLLQTATIAMEGQIYRLDLTDGTSTRVDARLPLFLGNTYVEATAAAISDDGRFVAFQALDIALVPFRGSPFTNVFLRDMLLGTNLPVSTNPAGLDGNRHSFAPMLDGTGRWVLFLSAATDLATNFLSDGPARLFLSDQVSNQLQLLSWDGAAALACVGRPAWSPDAGLVAFTAADTNTDVRSIYRCNFGGTASWVADNAASPAMDRRGTRIAFQTWQPAGLGPFTNQIMCYNVLDRSLSLVSASWDSLRPAQGNSSSPLITADGRFVVFKSQATDLVPNHTSGLTDLFVRDLVTSNTLLITASLRGERSVPAVAGPVTLGADGQTVIFRSYADDLVSGDYNGKADVFFLRLAPPDADGDGMDDDWEIAFFNSLDRDGSGDWDGDGATDLQEFRAGTDPTNEGSVLRAWVLSSLHGGSTVLWPAVVGRRYQVQYKDNLAATNWLDLPGRVVVNGGTGSAVDATGSSPARRFYRVVVQP